jgi:Putative peptidoglycan binding domain
MQVPATIRQGSAGLEVKVLQIQLNLAYPHKTRLVVDGSFGPLTRARVVDFQRDKKLAVDAIVGPLTWAALGQVRGQRSQSKGYLCCDNRNPYLQGHATRVAQAFLGITKPVLASVTIGGLTVTQLMGSQWEKNARAVYGHSLFYDRIFLSSALGVQNRAFALPVYIPPTSALLTPSLPLGGWVQVLNVGKQPSLSTIIHELGHAWQSQHHFEGGAYLKNCLACQAAALAANEVIGAFDASVKSNNDWPENFPMSAYAYIPGGPFGVYGGEQIAQQIENGEPDIVSYVKAIPPGLTDPSNSVSLGVGLQNMRQMEDRRAPGVII